MRKNIGKDEIIVEVISLNPIMLGHCEHCEVLLKGFGFDHKKFQLIEFPQELIEISDKITRFVNKLSRKSFVKLIIIEALTLRGLLKMLRYRSGKLPVILVNGSKIASGQSWDPEELADKVLSSLS